MILEVHSIFVEMMSRQISQLSKHYIEILGMQAGNVGAPSRPYFGTAETSGFEFRVIFDFGCIIRIRCTYHNLQNKRRLTIRSLILYDKI